MPRRPYGDIPDDFYARLLKARDMSVTLNELVYGLWREGAIYRVGDCINDAVVCIGHAVTGLVEAVAEYERPDSETE